MLDCKALSDRELVILFGHVAFPTGGCNVPMPIATQVIRQQWEKELNQEARVRGIDLNQHYSLSASGYDRAVAAVESLIRSGLVVVDKVR